MTSEQNPHASWKSAEISVFAQPVLKYAFMTVSIDVLLNGRLILATGGALKVTGNTTQEFEHQGQLHLAKMSWGKGKLKSFPITLTIDGEHVLEGEVTVAKWWLSHWISLAFLGVVGWSAFGG
jgi:hypothetical protein